MFEFVAGDGKPRLDRFLLEKLPTLSLTRIRRMIAEGEVLVNGAQGLKGARLASGDLVRISQTDQLPTSSTPEPIPLEILYEDDVLIAVNKPAGLLTHPSHREKSGTLTNALSYHFLQTAGHLIRPGLVHRLDRDTSGVIVIAKTERAHRTLSKAFRERWVRKSYLAIVTGCVADEAGEIKAPIGFDPSTWPRWRVMDDGRAAETRYRVMRRFANHTLIELEPLTGRTHQIRIHCALIGHPLFGDQLYGRRRDEVASRLAIRHHLLHAHKLALRHPATREDLELRAPMPSKWIELIAALETEDGQD